MVTRSADISFPKPPVNGVVTGVCPHDCPDCCSLHSRVAEGRLVKVEGNPEHPVTRGFICRKFARSPERLYAGDRLLYPLKRVGRKGDGKFKRITWEEAVETITSRWKAIITERGPEGILPFYGSGTEGLINGRLAGRRFFNRMGTLQLDRTICTKSGRTGFQYTMGTSMGADPTAIAGNRLIIAWGTNTSSTSIHHHVDLHKARRNGATYVVINPVRVRGANSAEYFLQPRPGSDAALALGMMHVIISEDLYDKDFVDRHTLGFAELQERTGEYPPERVAGLTDIPAQDIRDFARLYARLRPSFIYVGPGCQRHSNGGMTVRTIACLPALVGAWQHEGSGMYFPTSTIFPVDLKALEGEELRPNPATKYNMIELGKLLNGTGPHIESLYVFNGNPATVLFNQNRLRKRLRRDDLFTVVHELYMTDTARFADVVLPATSQFECTDLFFSYYHFNVQLNLPAIEPLGECRSNLETFRLLAAAMDFDDPCFKQQGDEIVKEILDLEHPVLNGISAHQLLKKGWARASLESAQAFVREGRFPTPSGRIEFCSNRMERDGFDPLPAYIPPRESRERTPGLFTSYPLFFITASAHSALNTNYAREAGKQNGTEQVRLLINPADAISRDISDGALVRVFNRRGSCFLHAAISKDVKPGVVTSPGLWWGEQYPGGCNANHTTPDFTADIGGGSAFNSNLVQLESALESVAESRPPAGGGSYG